MKQVLDFIERHKKFIKKLIIFTIVYFLMAICNNPNVEYLLKLIFGEYLTLAIHAFFPTYIMTCEV